MKYNYNYLTKREYEGKNQMTLAMAGFNSKEWATYLQWQEAGFKIKKGSKGQPIMAICRTDDETDETVGIKFYRVFNIEQVEKMEDKKDEQ